MTAQVPVNTIFARLSEPSERPAMTPLIDQHQRSFTYLRLSVTDVCNFSCNYCLPDGYQCDNKETPLTLAEIHTLVSLMAKKGIKKVRITGGEPSVRKDIAAIIKTIKAIDGIEKVAITTNGYKLPQHIKQWVDAGLDAINISIDSLDPAQFQRITGHDRLHEVMTGLNMALALGITHVKVNAVLLKDYNFEEFDNFLNWIKTTPISLRFIELMETGDNAAYFARNHISGSTIENRLRDSGWVLKEKPLYAGPAKEFSHPNYHGSIGLIMPYSTDFCASCNRLRISSLGKLHLCLFGEQGHDVRPLLKTDCENQLSDQLDTLMGTKESSHFLSEHKTGSTRHLAMLGG
ncbi:GTP 3',8-cyclase MoaA [Pseudomonas sp. HK3]